MRVYSILVALSSVVCLFLVGGCGDAQKQTPHMGFGNLEVKSEITRADIVVLDRVVGVSSTESILFGAVQIVDGDKLILLGIPFFKQKYAYFGTGSLFAQTADRAYYKALEAAPDADSVFCKSMDNESEGIPLLWAKKTVTWKGKAIKLKADQ